MSLSLPSHHHISTQATTQSNSASISYQAFTILSSSILTSTTTATILSTTTQTGTTFTVIMRSTPTPITQSRIFSQQARSNQRAPSMDSRQSSEEQLPAYSDAMKGQEPIEISEKELQLEQPSEKRSSKMSTLKQILKGDVHKHNPRYVLEASVTAQPSKPRSEPSKPKSKSSSTLKSVLNGELQHCNHLTTTSKLTIHSGDVQRFHPMYRLEESVQPSVRFVSA